MKDSKAKNSEDTKKQMELDHNFCGGVNISGPGSVFGEMALFPGLLNEVRV